MATTLYHGEPNGPSLTVLAALAETDGHADLVAIDLTKGERHGADVPRNVEAEMSVEGEGPLLVVDGVPMSDSVFIACYLDEVRQGGGAAIRPADPLQRWEMMSWCRYVIERIAPATAYLGTRAHLADDLAAMPAAEFEAMTSCIASTDLRERWEQTRAKAFADDKVADSEAKIAEGVKRTEAKLADNTWLIGDFSIADLETYAWLAGAAELVPAAFADAPRVNAWMERVKARPSITSALSKTKSGKPLTAWVPGPEINRWG